MAKYGLTRGTLKGELFSILLIKGTDGMKVHELAKLQSVSGCESQSLLLVLSLLLPPLHHKMLWLIKFFPFVLKILELNLAATAIQLEDLISSTLSSDITLFEKISSSGYRLRINPSSLESEISFSDSEGDDAEVISGYIRDNSDCESRELVRAESERRYHQFENKNGLSTVNTEIDESYAGEAWLLGLMEGEYSDLGIEEKLNALVALVDLLTAASSITETVKYFLTTLGPLKELFALGCHAFRFFCLPVCISCLLCYILFLTLIIHFTGARMELLGEVLGNF